LCGNILDVFFFTFALSLLAIGRALCAEKICGGVSRDFWADFSALREKCFGGVFETLLAIAERFALNFVSLH